MIEVEVPASHGHPYVVSRDDRGRVRLKRQTISGRTLTVVFSRDDVHNVTNALVDLAEREK